MAEGNSDIKDAKSEERDYFDAALETCKAFIYSGCGGNWNSFTIEAACDASCLSRSPL